MSKANRNPSAHTDVRRARVENPYFQKDHREGATNPRHINADLNVKESAVETLFARRFLGFSQKRAADKFRELWETAGGKASSIDYTLDRVDGGKSDVVATRLIAAQEMKRCRELLGVRGFETIQKVCAEGRSLTEITPHKRERLTMADNLRADLDDLAAMWGMQTKKR
ncbi:hypothetical protein [Mesorhizobium sp. B2-3-2]|uniref:hypothetical protein n=1 Tax=Mesorhizobium sp. B2-3-2 TaxID=2589961 RepID=UPI0011283906|nr:hypothetical protein [Mesorhizobium sp. B2-3-2]TPM37039.1 hypothetical protein FJ964_30355 [Mesorhizobium sp. B2-3-2]